MIFDQKKNVEMRKYDSYNIDLLGLMMNAYKNELKDRDNFLCLSLENMVDECKTFFTVGSETTTTLLTWTLILLRIHIDWQGQAREEVLQIFNKETPKFDAFSSLKFVRINRVQIFAFYIITVLLLDHIV